MYIRTADEWQVDLQNRRVQNACGLSIVFDGIPDSDDFNGSPQNIPRNLAAHTLARLIREGFDEFRAAYRSPGKTL